jgi:hypothetical protein
MPQRDEAVGTTDGVKAELLTLLNALSNVTQQLTDGTEKNEFESLTDLVQQRENKIHQLQKFDVETYRESNAGVIDEEVRRALADVNERSRIMQETIVHKSKSLLTTLTSLQHNRYYSS